VTTYVVLLRGINVGKNRKLPMAELRTICVDAGCADVRTYIQSGNVVLRSAQKAPALVAELERRIRAHTGFDVPIVVRTVDELESVVARCPFDTSVDPTTLVVAFSQQRPPRGALRDLDAGAFGDEQFVLDGRDLYLSLPGGQGRSKLAAAVARTRTGAVATVRNWKTVETLLALAQATTSGR